MSTEILVERHDTGEIRGMFQEELLQELLLGSPILEPYLQESTIYLTSIEPNWTMEAVFYSPKAASQFLSDYLMQRGGSRYLLSQDSNFSHPDRFENLPPGTPVQFMARNRVLVGDTLYTFKPLVPLQVCGSEALLDLVGHPYHSLREYYLDPGPLLKGSEIIEIQGLHEFSPEVCILTDKGTLTLGHERKCCEEILLLDFNGNPQGQKVVKAEVRFSESDTFYHFNTEHSSLTLRFGDSDHSRYGSAVRLRWEPA